MKKDLILGALSVSFVMSANSFAIDIHGGKLINEKEWTTGNIRGSFEDSAKDK